MVRPESCTVPAGGSPVRVSAGAPGSRHQSSGETPGAKRCVEGLEVGGSKEAGRNHVNAAASSHYQPKGVWEGRAGHVAAKAMDSVLVPERALGLPGVRAAVHSEGRREAAAAWDPDGSGPRGADGDEISHRAGLRGGFSAGKLRLQPRQGTRARA